MEDGKPDSGVISHLGNHFIGNGGGFRTSRQHGQFVIETGKIEFHHDAVMALLDQKLVTLRRKLFAHQFELGFGQREPFNVVAPRPKRVGQHDLGGDLFKNRMADVALERVGR